MIDQTFFSIEETAGDSGSALTFFLGHPEKSQEMLMHVHHIGKKIPYSAISSPAAWEITCSPIDHRDGT
jgi:hypothetical protein